ncbi:MAG: DUF72 domain-containing protein [Chloroflexi bacterium]|nr:DUF72 domain-containing protein [Chloroflexota bacterium]
MTAEATKPACYIGTSGWVYPHWRGILYPWELPTSQWLRYYATRFDTVEVNNTFYHLPSEQTFRSWKEEAPDRFLYAIKASRYITHMKKLAGVEEALARFLERSRLLGEHLGPVLYQLPPRWACNLERLHNFLHLLPGDLRHVFEFRHASWLEDAAFSLLEEHGVAFCIVSLPDFPCLLRVTAPFVYIRLHGAEAKYGSCYREEELQWWAEQILGFLADGNDVYVYFNNDAFGYAVENALRLKELVGN